MWGSVLVLALLGGLNPVRLGLILLVISRPRPVQNLLAFWVGALTASLLNLLVPLTVLHATPMLRSFAQDFGKSSARHMQIGIGVLALSIAALMVVRLSARQRAHLSAPGGNTSTLVADSNVPPAISRLLGRAQDAPTEGGSAIRRLLGRAHNAWEKGSLWVALVIGMGMGPAAEEILVLLAIIVASGAAVGTQVSAAIAFVVGMLGVVEVMLISYLATPAKTQAGLRLLQDWARAHRQKILVAMFAVGGVSLVVNGIRGL
jgi:Sap-like sulfolipid-1-addressing protein